MLHSAKLAVDGGTTAQLPPVWSSLAYVQARTGHFESAVRIMGANDALAHEIGLVLPPVPAEVRRAAEQAVPDRLIEGRRVVGETPSAAQLGSEVETNA